jgi:hypothetical protein
VLTAEPISTKLCWDDPWVFPFQNCGRQHRLVSKMAAITKSSKFIKNPVIYVKKLIIMLIQFKFGHFLA